MEHKANTSEPTVRQPVKAITLRNNVISIQASNETDCVSELNNVIYNESILNSCK